MARAPTDRAPRTSSSGSRPPPVSVTMCSRGTTPCGAGPCGGWVVVSGAKTPWTLAVLAGDDIAPKISLRRRDPDQVWTVGVASAPSQPGALDSREGQADHNGKHLGGGNRAPDRTIVVNSRTRSASQSDVRWSALGHDGSWHRPIARKLLGENHIRKSAHGSLLTVHPSCQQLLSERGGAAGTGIESA